MSAETLPADIVPAEPAPDPVPAGLIESLEACLAAVRDGYGDPPTVPREYPELSADAGGTWYP